MANLFYVSVTSQKYFIDFRGISFIFLLLQLQLYEEDSQSEKQSDGLTFLNVPHKSRCEFRVSLL